MDGQESTNLKVASKIPRARPSDNLPICHKIIKIYYIDTKVTLVHLNSIESRNFVVLKSAGNPPKPNTGKSAKVL